MAELTGVRVRETVPDDELGRADEIVLVDLPPEDLIARLRDGKVYPDAARVGPALNGFFRVENLRALREVALRQVAENVEARRLVASTSRSPSGCSRSSGSTPRDERVVRRAVALGAAARRRSSTCSSWPRRNRSAAERERLEALRRLTAMLGAHLLVEEGEDEVAVLERVARERGTTYVLLGAPPARRGLDRLAEPLVMRILRALPDVDVRIVAQR